MQIHLLSTPDDLQRYGVWVRSHPHGTLWQSLEWKRYQEAIGRDVRIYVQEDGNRIRASALVVIDRTAFGLSTWDIPRGPLGEEAGDGMLESSLLQVLLDDARRDRCMTFLCSPPVDLQLSASGFRGSTRHTMPDATRLIDLSQTEDAILAHMHPKGRYNIRVAERHGVTVDASQDATLFHTLLQQSAGRDHFTPPSAETCAAFLHTLPGSFLLIAHTKDRQPIAGLLGVVWPALPSGGTAATDAHPLPPAAYRPSIGIYYYGGASYVHRALMAPYALQWAALRHCKAAGCAGYDLLGVAPPQAASDHPWKGISGFKEKFGGTIVLSPPEQERVLRPLAATLVRWKRRLAG